jgi:hypothetical protein
MLTDRTYNYESTWRFVDNFYALNMTIYNSVDKFTTVNSALLKLTKYSLTAFLPYDFSKVDEIIRQKEDIQV